MEFYKYQHIERLGTDAVDGILDGKVYVFSKIDGTCCSVWFDDGIVRVGSRNRVLSLGFDNAGSCAYVLSNDKYKKYLEKHPNHILYGEYLAPHTIRCYEDDAWRKLYIFDVVQVDGDVFRYLSYDEYVPILEEFNIEYIPVTAILENPSEDEVREYKDKCTYLIKENGFPEGCVLKNYSYKNKYGHIIWAKIVREQMKLSHKAHRQITQDSIEQAIIDELCTPEFIEKEYTKFINSNGWNSKLIPKLLDTIFYIFITEECWNFIRKFKYPTVNFKILKGLVIAKIKEVKSECF